MGDHEQFGRPPNLRPRSAGVRGVASLRAIAPEVLATEAARTNTAATLSERLQAPRPGSATAGLRARRPSPSGSEGDASMGPTVLLSKPPMRPRSAMPGARGIVSSHRLELLQGQYSDGGDNQRGEEAREMMPQLQRAVTRAHKEDHVQPESSTPASANVTSMKVSLKRPFSAAPSVSASNRMTESPARTSSLSSDATQDQKPGPSVLFEPQPAPARVKRPFSAAPAFRGSSPRTSALQNASLALETSSNQKHRGADDSLTVRAISHSLF